MLIIYVTETVVSTHKKIVRFQLIIQLNTYITYTLKSFSPLASSCSQHENKIHPPRISRRIFISKHNWLHSYLHCHMVRGYALCVQQVRPNVCSYHDILFGATLHQCEYLFICFLLAPDTNAIPSSLHLGFLTQFNSESPF